MTHVERRSVDEEDPAALVAAVLEEEAKRRDDEGTRAAALAGGATPMPGVGGVELEFSEVVRRGGLITVLLLTLVATFDNAGNAAFGVLAPDIQRSLHIGDVGIGVIGALSGFTLVLAAIPLGVLGDRARRSSIVAICTLVWAVFTALTGMVHAVWQLVAARTATGIGQANEGPVQGSILADAYPPEGRGRIFGIHRAAAPLGLLFGPVLAGTVSALAGGTDGWRWWFVTIALPVTVLGVAVLLMLPEPRRGRYEQLAALGEELPAIDDELPVALGAAFARLKKIKSFYYLMAAFGAFGVAVVSAPIYLNLILKDELGLGVVGRGVVGSIVATGAVAGAMIGGWHGDRLFHADPPSTMRLMAGALAALGVGFGLQALAPNTFTYTAIGVVASGALYAGLVPASPLVAAIVPYRLRSTGFAMVGLYLSLVGGLGGAVLMGAIADSWGERTAVSIVAPVAGAVAAAVVLHGSRFVVGDIATAAADVVEEHAERTLVASGADLPILQVRNLDYSYGPMQVLFDVNLDVREGEVLALLGTNGAGKSTLLRAISGLGLADRGSVRFRGRTITFADPTTRVHLGIVQVPGGKAIFPSMSVRENLLAGAYSFIWEPERIRARTARVLELFPVLQDRLDQPAGTLSGGEQQMLGLAQALLLEPSVLLIDELSLGLAPIVVQQLLDVVEQLKTTGVTMVIVEQSVNVALSIADRAVFMEKGQVRFEGAASDLLERDDLVRAVFLGGEGS